ncbi:MAG: phosphatase PAP2 family protein [Oligoflexia bacterium]|nr:phosphatase PAP2 family protein [Oligoflexia bacterium]
MKQKIRFNILTKLFFPFLAFCTFLIIYTSTAHGFTTAKGFVDELISPVTTKAREPLIIGSTLTSLIYLFRNNTSVPLQAESIKHKPLGHTSIYGDYVGQLFPNALYFVAAGGYGLIAKNSTAIDNATQMLFATLYSGAMVNVLKYTIREKRPDTDTRNSFPSGHSTTAFAFAAVVAQKHAWYWGTFSYALATFASYSRINDNRHWLHDVIAGATLGLSYGLGICYLHDSNEDKDVNKNKNKTAIPTILILPTSDNGAMISYSYKF